MKKTDLAYTAGIVDGEGCIRIYKSSRKGHKYLDYVLRVDVTNTEIWLCQWLRFAFGGTVHKHGSLPHCKLCWSWVIQAKAAGEFLQLILPYLNIKRPQAELGIKFQNSKIPKRTSILTEEERAIREVQRILMQNLKRTKSRTNVLP